ERELRAAGHDELVPLVLQLPRRFLHARPAAAIARHLMLALPRIEPGQVRIAAHPMLRRAEVWELLVAARDRPGLLAALAGVLALRGLTVLGADAATCTDGTALDAFAVTSAFAVPLDGTIWEGVARDVEAALAGRQPLDELIRRRGLRYDRPSAGQTTV